MFFSHRVVKISADIHCVLGCGSGHLVTCSAADDLEANLGFLRDRNGNKFLFISIDALYVGPVLLKIIENELKDQLGPHQILVGASHSHNSPMLDDTKPLLGQHLGSHVVYVAERIVVAAKEVISDPGVEVTARSRQYRVNTAIYRRKITPIVISRRGVAFFKTEQRPNFRNELKPTSEVIDLLDSKQDLIGTIWVMPCHPTSYPVIDQVSSHYIGYVRHKLRNLTGNSDFPLLFFQGASGDLRPPAIAGRKSGLKGFLKTIFQPRYFTAFGWEEYDSWCEDIWREFIETRINLDGDFNREPSSTLSSIRKRLPLEELFEYNYDFPRTVDCYHISIGSIRLLALSAEVTWKYRESISFSEAPTTVIGCIGDTFGYLASKQQFDEGGYEAHGFESMFGLKPRVGADLPKTINRLILETCSYASKKYFSNNPG